MGEAAYNGILVGSLLLLAGWLFALIRINAKKIDTVEHESLKRVDCLEGDMTEMKQTMARVEERVKAMGHSFVSWKTEVYAPFDRHVRERLDKLVKFNNKGG